MGRKICCLSAGPCCGTCFLRVYVCASVCVYGFSRLGPQLATAQNLPPDSESVESCLWFLRSCLAFAPVRLFAQVTEPWYTRTGFVASDGIIPALPKVVPTLTAVVETLWHPSVSLAESSQLAEAREQAVLLLYRMARGPPAQKRRASAACVQIVRRIAGAGASATTTEYPKPGWKAITAYAIKHGEVALLDVLPELFALLAPALSPSAPPLQQDSDLAMVYYFATSCVARCLQLNPTRVLAELSLPQLKSFLPWLKSYQVAGQVAKRLSMAVELGTPQQRLALLEGYPTVAVRLNGEATLLALKRDGTADADADVPTPREGAAEDTHSDGEPSGDGDAAAMVAAASALAAADIISKLQRAFPLASVGADVECSGRSLRTLALPTGWWKVPSQAAVWLVAKALQQAANAEHTKDAELLVTVSQLMEGDGRRPTSLSFAPPAMTDQVESPEVVRALLCRAAELLSGNVDAWWKVLRGGRWMRHGPQPWTAMLVACCSDEGLAEILGRLVDLFASSLPELTWIDDSEDRGAIGVEEEKGMPEPGTSEEDSSDDDLPVAPPATGAAAAPPETHGNSTADPSHVVPRLAVGMLDGEAASPECSVRVLTHIVQVLNGAPHLASMPRFTPLLDRVKRCCMQSLDALHAVGTEVDEAASTAEAQGFCTKLLVALYRAAVCARVYILLRQVDAEHDIVLHCVAARNAWAATVLSTADDPAVITPTGLAKGVQPTPPRQYFVTEEALDRLDASAPPALTALVASIPTVLRVAGKLQLWRVGSLALGAVKGLRSIARFNTVQSQLLGALQDGLSDVGDVTGEPHSESLAGPAAHQRALVVAVLVRGALLDTIDHEVPGVEAQPAPHIPASMAKRVLLDMLPGFDTAHPGIRSLIMESVAACVSLPAFSEAAASKVVASKIMESVTTLARQQEPQGWGPPPPQVAQFKLMVQAAAFCQSASSLGPWVTAVLKMPVIRESQFIELHWRVLRLMDVAPPPAAPATANEAVLAHRLKEHLSTLQHRINEAYDDVGSEWRAFERDFADVTVFEGALLSCHPVAETVRPWEDVFMGLLEIQSTVDPWRRLAPTSSRAERQYSWAVGSSVNTVGILFVSVMKVELLTAPTPPGETAPAPHSVELSVAATVHALRRVAAVGRSDGRSLTTLDTARFLDAILYRLAWEVTGRQQASDARNGQGIFGAAAGTQTHALMDSLVDAALECHLVWQSRLNAALLRHTMLALAGTLEFTRWAKSVVERASEAIVAAQPATVNEDAEAARLLGLEERVPNYNWVRSTRCACACCSDADFTSFGVCATYCRTILRRACLHACVQQLLLQCSPTTLTTSPSVPSRSRSKVLQK